MKRGLAFTLLAEDAIFWGVASSLDFGNIAIPYDPQVAMFIRDLKAK